MDKKENKDKSDYRDEKVNLQYYNYTDDTNTNKSTKLNLVKKSKRKCFTRYEAEKEGCTMQTIRNGLKIGTLTPEVIELINLANGRNVSSSEKYGLEFTQTKMLHVARLTPEEQKLFVELYQEYAIEENLDIKGICEYIIGLGIGD